jgi:energy-coupling factor transporter ATP-binding protein EcfA2
MQSRLLLLDEPLASLDPASARETLALLRSLVDDGHTLLLVEHRIEDVLELRPEQVLFMRDGQQAYWGDLARFEAVADPREVKLPALLVAQWAKRHPPTNDLPVPPAPAHGNGAPLIEFEHVDFCYEPDQPVLKDLNLMIRQGDVVAILGPNGAGKSTLVKHMIGLLKPNGGEVRIMSRSSKALTTAQIAASVGYVFQHPGHMLFAPSVREELAFGPRNLGFDPARIARNVAQAIELLGLVGMEDRPPLALSYGQQKRVGIGAVLAMESRVLVMDEPTAGQDHRSYTAFMDAITRLQSFDALVFITHDLDLALTYANRIVLVADGQVAADGPPPQVLADEALLRRCRVEPTSLLRLNLALLPATGRFLRAEGLARYLKEDTSLTSSVGVGPDQP